MAYAFPAAVFGECVYGVAQAVGFFFGWLSTGLWIVSMYPQVRLTCLLRRAESLSIWFLILWTVGDALNLVSLVLLSKLLTQVVVGVVWLVMGVVATAQQAFYKLRARRMKRVLDGGDEEKDDDDEKNDATLRRRTRYSALEIVVYVSLALVVLVGTLSYSIPAMALYKHGLYPECQRVGTLASKDARFIAGTVLSYLPIPLNLVTRILQLIRTIRTARPTDLSIGFFSILVLANLTQVLSIVVDDDLVGQIPFILSALLPMAFDIAILVLVKRKGRREVAKSPGGSTDVLDSS